MLLTCSICSQGNRDRDSLVLPWTTQLFLGQREKTFPMDSVTNCHKLSGLKHHKFITPPFWTSEVQNELYWTEKKALEEPPAETLEENPIPASFSFWHSLARGHITLVSASVITLPPPHICPIFLVTALKPHPDIPGESPTLQSLTWDFPDGPVVGTSLSSTEGCRFNHSLGN